MSITERITKDILEKYRSFESPWFGFAMDIYKQNPYRNIISKLEEYFLVTDDTDLNNDVCFTLILSDKGSHWLLLLSMLGKYALFFRHTLTGRALLYQDTPGVTDIEVIVLNLLNSEGFVMPGPEIISTKLNFYDEQLGVARNSIYYCLFSREPDVDEMLENYPES